MPFVSLRMYAFLRRPKPDLEADDPIEQKIELHPIFKYITSIRNDKNI